MYKPTPDVSCLLALLFSAGPRAGPDLQKYVVRFDNAAKPDGLVTDEKLRAECADLLPQTVDGLKCLFELQADIMAKHFPAGDAADAPVDFGDLALAFIDFGQGTLCDSRRPLNDNVHTMDVNNAGDLEIGGYRRWYAIARIATLLNDKEDDAPFRDMWLQICRLIGTAWQIQTAVLRSATTPPQLAGTALQACIDHWRSSDWATMDARFLNNQPPPCL
jgi:hypothetical protein